MAAADLLPTFAAVSAEQSPESTPIVANFANGERVFRRLKPILQLQYLRNLRFLRLIKAETVNQKAVSLCLPLSNS